MSSLRRVVVLLGGCVSSIGAQGATRVDVGVKQFAATAGQPTLFSVAPGLTYSRDWFLLASSGTFTRERAGLAMSAGDLSVQLMGPRAGFLSGSLGAEARRDVVDSVARATSAAVSGQLMVSWMRAGVSGTVTGVTGYTSLLDGARSTTNGTETRVSAWALLSDALFSASLRARGGSVHTRELQDSLGEGAPTAYSCHKSAAASNRSGPPLSTSMRDCLRSVATVDVDAGVEFHVRELDLEGRMGGRPSMRGLAGVDKQASASLRLEYPVSGTMSVLGSVSKQPSDVARGLPARSQAFFGFRLHRAEGGVAERGGGIAVRRSAFEVGPDVAGFRTIRLDLPTATSVEMAGDMTGWRPVEMTRAMDGRWEVSLRLPAGVYTCALRVDHDVWIAPPGLPRTHDEFHDEAGVLEIQ